MRSEISGRHPHGLSRSAIRKFVDACWAALRRAGVAGEFDEVSIRLTSDEEMRGLNRSWRSIDRTTDVLTFPSAELDRPEGVERSLGDIVISVDQARRQARTQRHDLATEIRYLILHGMIHALGYDHETDEGEMNALETRIRGRVGLD